ncbi:MAG: group II intron maturase-specific domain-containing protein [Paludibacter sp.]
MAVSYKNWKNLKEKLKTIIKKSTPMTFDQRVYKLKLVQRGWLEYFHLVSIQAKLVSYGWQGNLLD